MYCGPLVTLYCNNVFNTNKNIAAGCDICIGFAWFLYVDY